VLQPSPVVEVSQGISTATMTNLVDGSPPENLGRLTFSGVGWTVAARYMAHLIGFCSSVLLARLIEPAIFGLVGMLTLTTGVAAILIDVGLGSALVQRRQLTPIAIDTAFWTSLGLGTAMGATLACAAGLIASFFSQPELVRLVHLACLGLPFTGLATVPSAILVRRLEIRSVEITTLLGTATGVLVTVVLALIKPGPLPLVIGPLTATILTSLGLFAISPVRPAPRFQLAALRSMVHVAAFQAGFNIVNFWNRNVDNLLVARFLGTVQLGYYSRAYTLMLLPMFAINHPMAKTLTSVLARLQNDVARSKAIFLKAERLIAFISFPSMVGLCVVADPLIRTLYGENWIPVIPLLRILALAALFQGIAAACGWVFISQGRTDLMFKCELAQAILVTMGCSVAVAFGSLLGVAFAFAVAEILIVLPTLALAGRLIDASLHEFFTATKSPAICSFVMGAVVWTITDVLMEQATPLMRLAFGICSGSIAYGVLSLVFQRKSLQDFTQFMRSRGA
jgi:PST family polysaccharide transporter